MSVVSVNRSRAHALDTTELWLLFGSLSGLGSSAVSPSCIRTCCRDWAGCVRHCDSVHVVEQVLELAFQDGRYEARELRQCQLQLLAKRLLLLLLQCCSQKLIRKWCAACSLNPNLTDTGSCQLLQHCLLQGALSSNLPAVKKLLKHIDDCTLDLCCTHVRSVQGMLVSLQQMISFTMLRMVQLTSLPCYPGLATARSLSVCYTSVVIPWPGGRSC